MPLYLTIADIVEINSNVQINDHHVEASLVMLRKQFPHIKGLYNINIFQIGDGYSPAPNNKGSTIVQIHKCKENHWIVSSSNPKDEAIYIYDSHLAISPTNNVSIPLDLELQLSKYYAFSNSMSLLVPEVQQQCNTTDSGLFAIAWAYELCSGKKPEKIKYMDKKMRSHLLKCFETEKCVAFPQRKIKTVPKMHEIIIPLICYCKQPPHFDNKLTSCTTCSSWFHNVCCDGATTQDWTCANCNINNQMNVAQGN